MGTPCIPPYFYYTYTHTYMHTHTHTHTYTVTKLRNSASNQGQSQSFHSGGRVGGGLGGNRQVLGEFRRDSRVTTVHSVTHTFIQQPRQQCSDCRLSVILCASSHQMATPVVLSKGFLAARNVKGGGGRWSREWSRLFDKLNSTGTVSMDLEGDDGWRGWWKQMHLLSQLIVNFKC